MVKYLGYCVLLLALFAAGCSDGASYSGPHHSVEVNDATFASTVLESEQPVMVDLWAPWCGPCRTLTPVVEAVAAEYKGRAIVVKVNVDEAPDVAAQYEVAEIPTLLFFQNGKMVERIKGVQSKGRLTQKLDAMLAE